MVFIYYFIAINVTAFFAFLVDKLNAKLKRRRISEKALIYICGFGGAFGGLLAMMIFNHKIRKPKFYIAIILFAVIYLAILLFIIIK